MKITIYPLERVTFDDVSISFGMDRATVETLMGKGHMAGSRYYYCGGELAIDYDRDDRVEFIEFLAGMDGSLRPLIYGLSAFETEAGELAAVLTQNNGGEITHTEQGHACRFSGISVGVYRELTPEDVLEMIEEMKANGIPTADNADLEADRRRAGHWSTIGTGIAGYYLL